MRDEYCKVLTHVYSPSLIASVFLVLDTACIFPMTWPTGAKHMELLNYGNISSSSLVFHSSVNKLHIKVLFLTTAPQLLYPSVFKMAHLGIASTLRAPSSGWLIHLDARWVTSCDNSKLQPVIKVSLKTASGCGSISRCLALSRCWQFPGVPS